MLAATPRSGIGENSPGTETDADAAQGPGSGPVMYRTYPMDARRPDSTSSWSC